MDRHLVIVMRALIVAATMLLAGVPARSDQVLGPGRIDDDNRVVIPDGPTLGTYQGGKYTATPDATILQGSNVYAPRAQIMSGQGKGAVANGIWQAPSWGIQYYAGPDFGNTTPIASQWVTRCTTIADPLRYESCVNVDFYNVTGATGPWPGASTTVTAGTFIQINGGSIFKATTAGKTGAAQPAWPTSGTVKDGTVVWSYQDAGYNAAKSGMSLSSVSTAGGGNHWLVNPNCIINEGFKSQLYCIELDVGNYSGTDWHPGSPVPGVQALWIGGVTANTGAATINIGSQHSTQGKPAWYFGIWCGNALAAGQTCFEDWSNSEAGFHTASFAKKTYDIWLQSSSKTGVNLNGTYSDAAINLQNATIQPDSVGQKHAMVLAPGQDVCFNGKNACWFWNAADGRMKLRINGKIVYSIDSNGSVRAKGGFTTDANP